MAKNNSNGDQGRGNDDRAEVDALLVEIDFPATRDDLVEAARDADATESVIVLLTDLPDGEYASRQDVDRALDRSSGGRK